MGIDRREHQDNKKTEVPTMNKNINDKIPNMKNMSGFTECGLESYLPIHEKYIRFVQLRAEGLSSADATKKVMSEGMPEEVQVFLNSIAFETITKQMVEALGLEALLMGKVK